MIRQSTPRHALCLSKIQGNSPHSLAQHGDGLPGSARCGRSKAFTIVELLVVIAIIGVLVSLLLPAVGAVRENARQVQCKNHLRQQAVATLGYAESHKEQLPPLWASNRPHPWENFSWRIELLPYLEQQNLYDGLDTSQPPFDPDRNLKLAQVRIAVFKCPSTPGSERRIPVLGYGDAVVNCDAASSDYVAIYEVKVPDRSYPAKGAWNGTSGDLEMELEPPNPTESDIALSPDSSQRTSRLGRTWPASLSAIRDGMSNTILLVEQAGKPNYYGHRASPTELDPIEGAWATAEWSFFSGEGINIDNQKNPYGFHNAAMAAMADGSVHFLSTEIASDVLRALMTARGREILAENDWR